MVVFVYIRGPVSYTHLDVYKRQLPAQTPAPEAGKVKRITRIEDTPEYAALQERFRAIHGENPYFVCHESPLMDTSVMDGHEVLNFGSYNYAGMSGRPETVNAAIEATRKYGTSASGSRLLGGEKKLHEQLEAAIAEWKMCIRDRCWIAPICR